MVPALMRIDASNLIAAQSAPRSAALKQTAPSQAAGMSFESLSFPKAATEARPPAPAQATPRTTAAQPVMPGKGAIPRLGSQLDIKV